MNDTQLAVERLRVLEETVEYYSHPLRRAVDGDGQCRYITPDGGRCAIGRLVDEGTARILEDVEGDGLGYGVCVPRIFSKLPAHVKALGKDFLRQLQSLHDDGIYWMPFGLTCCGEEKVKRIKSDVEHGRYPV